MSTTRITWKEAGRRYEAIDGELYVTDAPSLRHQWISGNLHEELRRLLMKPGHGYVFHAPVGVEFPETEEGVQPDIIFVAAARADRLVPEGIRGAPDLVVEILSPSTAQRDATIKRKLYERQGVAQYWLVDPVSNAIDVWDFAAKAKKPTRFEDRLPVAFGGISYGQIELAEIFPPEV
jgi:Uma2 family endonuclease